MAGSRVAEGTAAHSERPFVALAPFRSSMPLRAHIFHARRSRPNSARTTHRSGHIAFGSSAIQKAVGRVTGILPRAIASSIARSGNLNVCVGRWWQSTHCMSYWEAPGPAPPTSSDSPEPRFQSVAGLDLSPTRASLGSTSAVMAAVTSTTAATGPTLTPC